jgi:TolB-like protein
MNNNNYASNVGMYIVTFLLCALINGCSSPSPRIVERTTYQPNHTHQAQFIQNYIDSMTDSLIVSDHFYSIKKGRVAVGSIGMINTLKLSDDKTHPLNLLGLTLQDGLMTSLLNRGYLVVEYHRSKNIIIRDNQDLMLTRELEYLKQDQALSYFLTGTIAYQENGASVSLRIIDLENDQISAATTKFIPINVFWNNRNVTNYNGMLYRTNSYKGSN